MQENNRITKAEEILDACEIIELNQEFLGPLDDRPGVTFVRSAKGTGKTEILADLRRRYPNARIMVVGHRKHLLRSQATRLKLDYYEAVQVQGNDHLAITLDSLVKLEGSPKPVDILIMDEAEQVLSHLLDETMADRRGRVCPKLRHLIANARHVIALDADLSWLTFGTIHDARGGGCIPMRIIVNRFKPDRGNLHMVTRKAILSEIQAASDEGLRLYITSGSKATAKKIHAELKARHPDRAYLLVTADTAEKPEVKAFLRKPAGEATKYHAVVASPSLGTGIDLSFDNQSDNFDIVFGIFEYNHLTHFEISQQLARVRKPQAIRVYVTKMITDKSIAIETVGHELVEKDLAYLRDSFDADDNMYMKPGYQNDDLYKIGVSARKVQVASTNRLRANFIDHMTREGFTVLIEDTGEDAEAGGAPVAKNATDRELLVTRICEAEGVGRSEFELLEFRRQVGEDLSADEFAALEKIRIARFYRQPADKALIKSDAGGQLRKKVGLFELITNHGLLQQRAKARPIHLGGRPLARVFVDQAVREYLVEQLLKQSGLYKNGQFDAEIDITAEGLVPFQTYLQTHRVIFERQFSRAIGKVPVKTLQFLLSQLGLSLKEANVTEAGGKKVRSYRLVGLKRMVDLRDLRKAVSDDDFWQRHCRTSEDDSSCEL